MSDAPRPEPRPAPSRKEESAGGPYEFSEAHKESFRALAASISFVGVCSLLFAALSGVFALGEAYMGFIPNGIGTAAAAALNGVLAWWMLSAGRSLSALVRTRGRDVEHLMEAVTHLRKLFALARVAIIVIAMLVSALAAVVVWCTFVVDRGGKCFGLP
jgi:hypothetical protein